MGGKQGAVQRIKGRAGVQESGNSIITVCPGSNSTGMNGTAERDKRWMEMDEG